MAETLYEKIWNKHVFQEERDAVRLAKRIPRNCSRYRTPTWIDSARSND
ncbi:hypothetical protein V6B33_02160 [Mangrovibacillus sp. Mu-81]